MAKRNRAPAQWTSGLLDSLEVRVARQIRRLRKDKGLTQGELARLCGLSPAYLSRVEHNQAALTLTSLERVAQALEIPIKAFLDEEALQAPLSLHRASSRKMKFLRGRGSHVYQTLAAEKKGKLMEPMLVEVAASASSGRTASHAGEEFDYLICGTCNFFYGKETFAMAAGDAVYYDASVPHGIIRTSTEPARLLAIVSSRDYLFHGDIQRLLQSHE